MAFGRSCAATAAGDYYVVVQRRLYGGAGVGLRAVVLFVALASILLAIGQNEFNQLCRSIGHRDVDLLWLRVGNVPIYRRQFRFDDWCGVSVGAAPVQCVVAAAAQARSPRNIVAPRDLGRLTWVR